MTPQKHWCDCLEKFWHQVAPFRVAAAPVSVGAFYQFAVVARGYERRELWAPHDFEQFAGKGQARFLLNRAFFKPLA